MKGHLLASTADSCGPQMDIQCVLFTQRHEWDPRNVIATGCTDGVIRVKTFSCKRAWFLPGRSTSWLISSIFWGQCAHAHYSIPLFQTGLHWGADTHYCFIISPSGETSGAYAGVCHYLELCLFFATRYVSLTQIWKTEYTRTQLPGPPQEPASPGQDGAERNGNSCGRPATRSPDESLRRFVWVFFFFFNPVKNSPPSNQISP